MIAVTPVVDNQPSSSQEYQDEPTTTAPTPVVKQPLQETTTQDNKNPKRRRRSSNSEDYPERGVCAAPLLEESVDTTGGKQVTIHSASCSHCRLMWVQTSGPGYPEGYVDHVKQFGDEGNCRDADIIQPATGTLAEGRHFLDVSKSGLKTGRTQCPHCLKDWAQSEPGILPAGFLLHDIVHNMKGRCLKKREMKSQRVHKSIKLC